MCKTHSACIFGTVEFLDPGVVWIIVILIGLVETCARKRRHWHIHGSWRSSLRSTQVPAEIGTSSIGYKETMMMFSINIWSRSMRKCDSLTSSWVHTTNVPSKIRALDIGILVLILIERPHDKITDMARVLWLLATHTIHFS